MTDDQHAELPLFHSLEHSLPDLGLTDCIKHDRDFISNDKGSLRSQGAGNGQSLQFAAGQFMRIAVQPARVNAKLIKYLRLRGSWFCQRPAQLPAGIEAALRMLTDELDRAEALFGKRLLVDADCAALHRQVIAEHLGQGCLARAAGSNQAADLTCLKTEMNVLKDWRTAGIGKGKGGCFKHGRLVKNVDEL